MLKRPLISESSSLRGCEQMSQDVANRLVAIAGGRPLNLTGAANQFAASVPVGGKCLLLSM